MSHFFPPFHFRPNSPHNWIHSLVPVTSQVPQTHRTEGVGTAELAAYFASVVARRGEERGAAEGAAEGAAAESLLLHLRDYVHTLALPVTSSVVGVVAAVHTAVHAACAAAALAMVDGAGAGGESLTPPTPPHKSRERVESGSASAKVAPVVRTPSPTASGSDENV